MNQKIQQILDALLKRTASVQACRKLLGSGTYIAARNCALAMDIRIYMCIYLSISIIDNRPLMMRSKLDRHTNLDKYELIDLRMDQRDHSCQEHRGVGTELRMTC